MSAEGVRQPFWLLISQAKGQSLKKQIAFSEGILNSEKAFLSSEFENLFLVSVYVGRKGRKKVWILMQSLRKLMTWYGEYR